MIPGVVQEEELEDLDGLGVDDLNAIRCNQTCHGTPATAQQEANDEAESGGKRWGAGEKMEDLQWPSDMGEDLPAIMFEELLEAARTFPVETGLGWDQLHPMMILRLSHSTLLLLVTILMQCEQTGEWPAGVALVLIALLPKTDGGFRPIGFTFAAETMDEGQAESGKKMGRAQRKGMVVRRQRERRQRRGVEAGLLRGVRCHDGALGRVCANPAGSHQGL